MENDLISIQCDEVTKNMMNEIQDDMINSLNRVSKNMTQDVMDKLKPMEKKIQDLKNIFEDFVDDNEEFVDKVDSLSNTLDHISKSIEVIIKSSIVKVIDEQNKTMIEHNKVFSDNLQKIIENTVQIQDSIFTSKEEILDEVKKMDNTTINTSISSMQEKIENKIDRMNFEPLEDKLAILGVKLVKASSGNKDAIIEKIEEMTNDDVLQRVNELEQKVESNYFSNKELLLEYVNSIKDKIDEKEVLIERMQVFEEEFISKIDSIKEEVEWGNKSIFARLFGKKKNRT